MSYSQMKLESRFEVVHDAIQLIREEIALLPVGTLQSVTDEGNETTNEIAVVGVGNEVRIASGSVSSTGQMQLVTPSLALRGEELTFGETDQYLLYGGNGDLIFTSTGAIPDDGQNIQLYILLVGPAAGQTLSLPEAKQGYMINIICYANEWTVAVKGGSANRIFGGRLGSDGGTSFTIGNNQVINLVQLNPNPDIAFPGGFVVTSENVTGSDLVVRSVENTSADYPFYVASDQPTRSQSATIELGSPVSSGTVTLAQTYTPGAVIQVFVSVEDLTVIPMVVTSKTHTSFTWASSVAISKFSYFAVGY